MAKGEIKARVHCRIEIPVGTWSGGQTDLDQLTDQVRREGTEKIRKMVREVGGSLVDTPLVFFIVLQETPEK